jgi:hypothetical protein
VSAMIWLGIRTDHISGGTSPHQGGCLPCTHSRSRADSLILLELVPGTWRRGGGLEDKCSGEWSVAVSAPAPEWFGSQLTAPIAHDSAGTTPSILRLLWNCVISNMDTTATQTCCELTL